MKAYGIQYTFIYPPPPLTASLGSQCSFTHLLNHTFVLLLGRLTTDTRETVTNLGGKESLKTSRDLEVLGQRAHQMLMTAAKLLEVAKTSLVVSAILSQI